MKTNLPQSLLHTPNGKRADEILRQCVHCGFCNATCPTYQITGNELDGPRGRIYLIKEMLEGNQTTNSTRLHLDQCLTCLSCETTCPSGVKYGELIDIGRGHIHELNIGTFISDFKRRLIRSIFPYPRRFKPLYLLASAMGFISKQNKNAIHHVTQVKQTRKIILLDGCVQSVTSPEINLALKEIVHTLGISTISFPQVHCCGAIHHHNGSPKQALTMIKKNIDAWWEAIEEGCEAIVMTASGCGLTVKDYARLMKDDSEYAQKANKISELTLDASEYLADFKFTKQTNEYQSVAFHPPCTLQHGQKINQLIETILTQAGYHCVDFKDKHLCCGSAGSYSLLHPELASQLKKNKIEHIMQSNPDVIATANIGCILHLRDDVDSPVMHWLELITPKT